MKGPAPARRRPSAGTLRARGDLIVTRPTDGERDAAIVVKDPISLEYFRLGEREAFLLEELANPLTVNELHRRYTRRFPGERASADDVLAFCAGLSDCGLLAGGGAEPWKRVARPWPNPLAIRLPSFDPSPLLGATAWFGKIAYSRWFAAALVLVSVVALTLLLGRAEELVAALADLARLSEPRYALLGVAALVVVKAWHELGHALACRRFGVECPEMGVLLLVFVPCLYCDVTDALTLRDRRRRAIIALGGVYFEWMLAVAASLAWLILAPGVAQTLALYVAVAASLSTLLVNLNPLVRFDGYYLLADVGGVANLGQQSQRALWGGLGDWIAGRRRGADSFDAPRTLLAAYAAMSGVYKLVLLAVILWGLHAWLAANGFRVVGDVLVGISVVGVGAGWVRGIASLISTSPYRGRLAATGRLALVGGVAGLLLWLGWTTPIEQTLKSPCRLEAVRAIAVAAPVDGALEEVVDYGRRVVVGDVLARIHDPDAELRRLELLEELAGAEATLAGLRRRAPTDPALFVEIARVETFRGELRGQLRTHDDLARRRMVRAPISGRVLRPPERGEPEDSGGVRLAAWTGAALDPINRGCAAESGDELCVIADEALRAVVLLDQHDSGLIAVGDSVRIAMDRDPANRLRGVVEAIALASSDDAGARPIGTSDLLAERALRGSLDNGPTYRVAVALDGASPVAQHGALGQARIVTGRETLGWWCWRWARRTLRFP